MHIWLSSRIMLHRIGMHYRLCWLAAGAPRPTRAHGSGPLPKGRRQSGSWRQGGWRTGPSGRRRASQQVRRSLLLQRVLACPF